MPNFPSTAKAIFVALAITSPNLVQAAAQPSLNQLTHHSDLIIEGAVSAVDSRMISSRSNGNSIPFTYVTYTIRKIYKGAVEAGEITLRFLGGPTGESRYLLPENSPLFDAGDIDILMIKGNTEADCPLVGCQHGRFRLIDGGAYSEEGNTLAIADDGTIEKGRYIPWEDVVNHRMSATISLQRRQIDDDKSANIGPSSAAPTISEADLKQKIRSVLAHQINGRGSVPLFKVERSADPTERLDSLYLAPATPPVTAAQHR